MRVLGPVQLLVDGVDVTPAAPREQALLGLLVLDAGQVVSADRLVHELWPTLDAARARHVLQVRIAELRKLLRDSSGESRLVFTAPGYRLAATDDEVDERRFLALVDRARAASREGDAFAAAMLLREALGMWRGEPLAGAASSPTLDAEAARLAEVRVDAIEECVEAELACGYHRSLTFELEKLVADHPLRERLWAQQALALYRSGRQAEALRACSWSGVASARTSAWSPVRRCASSSGRSSSNDADLTGPRRPWHPPCRCSGPRSSRRCTTRGHRTG